MHSWWFNICCFLIAPSNGRGGGGGGGSGACQWVPDATCWPIKVSLCPCNFVLWTPNQGVGSGPVKGPWKKCVYACSEVHSKQYMGWKWPIQISSFWCNFVLWTSNLGVGSGKMRIYGCYEVHSKQSMRWQWSIKMSLLWYNFVLWTENWGVGGPVKKKCVMDVLRRNLSRWELGETRWPLQGGGGVKGRWDSWPFPRP